jgi:hypothetical protein
MVLPKGHFKFLDPLDNDGLLEAVGKMEAEAGKLDSKYEGAKGELKVLREKRKDYRDRISSALSAHEAGAAVYLLRDGKTSVEGPDSDSLNFSGAGGTQGARAGGHVEDDGDDDGTDPPEASKPKRRRAKAAEGAGA